MVKMHSQAAPCSTPSDRPIQWKVADPLTGRFVLVTARFAIDARDEACMTLSKLQQVDPQILVITTT